MATRQTLLLAYSDPLRGALREENDRRLRLHGSNSNLPTHTSDPKPEKITRRLWQKFTASSGFDFIPGQLECPSSGSEVVCSSAHREVDAQCLDIEDAAPHFPSESHHICSHRRTLRSQGTAFPIRVPSSAVSVPAQSNQITRNVMILND